MPVTRFVAPGPEVARQTPVRPGDPGVAVGGVSGGLLVADEDVLDVGVLAQCVVERQHHAARIAEEDIDTLGAETFHQDLSAGQPHGGFLIGLERGLRRRSAAALARGFEVRQTTGCAGAVSQ